MAKQARPKAAPRARKATTKIADVTPPLVSFSFQDVAYQIDLERSKVYRRFIEIEKSKQFSILNAYRTVRISPTL